MNSLENMLALAFQTFLTCGKAKAWRRPWSKSSLVQEFQKKEGADQLLTNCKQLKLKSADGKRYNTDVANTEQKRKPPGQHEHAGTGAEYACRGYYNSTDKSAES